MVHLIVGIRINLSMKNILLSIFTCCVLFIFTSCQKELSFEQSAQSSESVDAQMPGTWKFLMLDAKTNVVTEADDGTFLVKTVSTSEYVTSNNSGTLTVEPGKMITKDMAYSVNTVVKGYLYQDGVETDSYELPIDFTLPPSSATSSYTRIGADSIHFPGGDFINISGGGSLQLRPSGAKVKFEGDKMILQTVVSETETEAVSGATITTKNDAVVLMTFQRL